MARPRSDEKRTAILEAATRIIVSQGLSAPTAGIAKAAGIANGSFFTYFETKSDLLNQLYLELKRETAEAALRDFPEDADLREQVHHVWRNWMHYGARNPDKPRALMQLNVSDEITPQSRAEVQKYWKGMVALIERIRENGPLRNATRSFGAAIMNALGDATMAAMIQDPENADQHCEIGFEAFWRAIA